MGILCVSFSVKVEVSSARDSCHISQLAPWLQQNASMPRLALSFSPCLFLPLVLILTTSSLCLSLAVPPFLTLPLLLLLPPSWPLEMLLLPLLAPSHSAAVTATLQMLLGVVAQLIIPTNTV